MKVVVTDANILIDLCELGILEAFFALPYNMIVVESVWDELLEDQQQMYSNYMSGGDQRQKPSDDSEDTGCRRPRTLVDVR